MQVSRKRFTPHRPGHGAPICGFIGYAHPAEPTLFRRLGWEIGNDIHDAFEDQMSFDNGATWTEYKPSLARTKVDGGYIVHTENAIVLLPDGRMVHFTNAKFESNLENCDPAGKCEIRITVGTAEEISQGRGKITVSDYGVASGVAVSFCTPIIDSRGRILVPMSWQKRDTDGSGRRLGIPTRKDMPDVFESAGDAGLLTGVIQPSGEITWRRTGPVPFDFSKQLTSRGLCEATIAELAGGRLAMVIRGSNGHWPEKPGYKWLTFSEDGGETWSEIRPLGCDDGSLIESGATGSAFFRSHVDNRLYWIGNLCEPGGQRAYGNLPRSPLHVVRMNEDQFGIERDSISVIDRTRTGEHVETQHSNFKFYQDRVTHEIVLHLTRYGERGLADGAWMNADEYQYRFRVEDI